MIALLDRLRARTLAVVGPLAPGLLRDRERRVAVYGLVAIALALGLTFSAPMALLALGPLILGVPHLVADVRYLVARPRLHHRPELWVAIAAPACASWLHPHAWVALLAPALAALVARASAAARALAATASAVLLVLAAMHERIADLVLAHGHNAIAIAIFAFWTRRKGSLHLLVVLGFAAGAAAIALGAFDGLPSARLTSSRLLVADDLARSLAPFADGAIAVRMVLLFAFAQSVHYAVWVRLVPEEDRPRPGLRSFASTFAALRADLGVPLVALFGAVAVGLAGWGLVSLASARDGYLRLAVFHGPLELGTAMVLLLESGVVAPATLYQWTSPRRRTAQVKPAAT